MDEEDNEKYEVGYKKPPKNSRFQKGRSGNPDGRPKGKRNLKTELKEELARIITITEGGRTKRVTKSNALIKSLVARALKPDIKAITLITQLDQDSGSEDGGVQEYAELEANEQETLNRLIEKRAKSKNVSSRKKKS